MPIEFYYLADDVINKRRRNDVMCNAIRQVLMVDCCVFSCSLFIRLIERQLFVRNIDYCCMPIKMLLSYTHDAIN